MEPSARAELFSETAARLGVADAIVERTSGFAGPSGRYSRTRRLKGGFFSRAAHRSRKSKVGQAIDAAMKQETAALQERAQVADQIAAQEGWALVRVQILQYRKL
jgi:hypothetical protein